MSNTDQATPRPWSVTPDGFRIWSEDAGRVVGWTATNPGGRTDQARADARLIVQAVNAHDALVAAEARVKVLEAALWAIMGITSVSNNQTMIEVDNIAHEALAGTAPTPG